ncbi:Serine/threonine protein kinase [Forsythia ovata]|uniref:Serine/threonine protein kinase n=2 Tax=Forsythia ovata TaxID=205694 RepID=A0ABD1WCB6_9LAMI
MVGVALRAEKKLHSMNEVPLLPPLYSTMRWRLRLSQPPPPPVGVPREKSVESGETDGAASNFAAVVGAKEKEKGEANVVGDGVKKGLVFVGKKDLKFDLDDLLKASAEVLDKGTFGTAYKAVLETCMAIVVKRLRDVNLGEKFSPRDFSHLRDQRGGREKFAT